MAKKKKNVDVEIQVNDASLEIKRDETINEVNLDTKNLDVKVTKTDGKIEVKVEAEKPLLNFVGKVLGRYLSKKLK
jgi:ABC-type molybdate transport system ATPase subunit